MDYDGRISKVVRRFDDAGVDGLLVTNLTNVRYLTGFSGSSGQVLVTPSGTVFFSDPRYEARAADLVDGAEVVIFPTRLSDRLPEKLVTHGVKRLGVEARAMTIAQRDDLDERLPGAELIPTKDVVEDLRRAKDPEEIAALRRAVEFADATFEWILERLRPGATEREIGLDLEMRMRNGGAESVSFDPIVGSGALSAHIHHTPSARPLAPGDLVLLDFGCRMDGYCSDLTRTVVLGRATEEQRELYDVVLRAQRAGIEAVGPGVDGRAVDAAGRGVIEAAGYGAHFGHGLGHGVGLEVHEAPSLARTSEDTMAPGDVVTVEPGVYVRDKGGIRIEDCVLVTEDGFEVLGHAPKDRLITPPSR